MGRKFEGNVENETFLGDFHPLCLFGVWIGNEERRRGWRKIGKIYSKEKYYIAVDKAIHT